jgi:hypothetical protein
MSTYTNAEKAAEAAREVKMRREVYGRNAPGGVLFPAQERRIAVMQEIHDDYEALAEKERLL